MKICENCAGNFVTGSQGEIMKESTQGFLLGVSAALAGLMLYICMTHCAVFFKGNVGDESQTVEVGTSSEQVAIQSTRK